MLGVSGTLNTDGEASPDTLKAILAVKMAEKGLLRWPRILGFCSVLCSTSFSRLADLKSHRLFRLEAIGYRTHSDAVCLVNENRLEGVNMRQANLQSPAMRLLKRIKDKNTKWGLSRAKHTNHLPSTSQRTELCSEEISSLARKLMRNVRLEDEMTWILLFERAREIYGNLGDEDISTLSHALTRLHEKTFYKKRVQDWSNFIGLLTLKKFSLLETRYAYSIASSLGKLPYIKTLGGRKLVRLLCERMMESPHHVTAFEVAKICELAVSSGQKSQDLYDAVAWILLGEVPPKLKLISEQTCNADSLKGEEASLPYDEDILQSVYSPSEVEDIPEKVDAGDEACVLSPSKCVLNDAALWREHILENLLPAQIVSITEFMADNEVSAFSLALKPAAPAVCVDDLKSLPACGRPEMLESGFPNDQVCQSEVKQNIDEKITKISDSFVSSCAASDVSSTSPLAASTSTSCSSLGTHSHRFSASSSQAIPSKDTYNSGTPSALSSILTIPHRKAPPFIHKRENIPEFERFSISTSQEEISQNSPNAPEHSSSPEITPFETAINACTPPSSLVSNDEINISSKFAVSLPKNTKKASLLAAASSASVSSPYLCFPNSAVCSSYSLTSKRLWRALCEAAINKISLYDPISALRMLTCVVLSHKHSGLQRALERHLIEIKYFQDSLPPCLLANYLSTALSASATYKQNFRLQYLIARALSSHSTSLYLNKTSLLEALTGFLLPSINSVRFSSLANILFSQLIQHVSTMKSCEIRILLQFMMRLNISNHTGLLVSISRHLNYRIQHVLLLMNRTSLDNVATNFLFPEDSVHTHTDSIEVGKGMLGDLLKLKNWVLDILLVVDSLIALNRLLCQPLLESVKNLLLKPLIPFVLDERHCPKASSSLAMAEICDLRMKPVFGVPPESSSPLPDSCLLKQLDLTELALTYTIFCRGIMKPKKKKKREKSDVFSPLFQEIFDCVSETMGNVPEAAVYDGKNSISSSIRYVLSSNQTRGALEGLDSSFLSSSLEPLQGNTIASRRESPHLRDLRNADSILSVAQSLRVKQAVTQNEPRTLLSSSARPSDFSQLQR